MAAKSRRKPARPAPYHHGDLRNALIAAGQAILAEDGVTALSLREVARRAGVSHAAPYRHFADKDALLAAIAEEVGGTLTAYLLDAQARFPNDYRNQFVELGWAYVRFGLEKPDQLRVLFGNFVTTPNAPLRAAFELLVETIRRGQAAGVFIEAQPLSLAMTTWAMVHGLTMLLIEHSIIPGEVLEAATKEQLARTSLQILLGGVEQRPRGS